MGQAGLSLSTLRNSPHCFKVRPERCESVCVRFDHWCNKKPAAWSGRNGANLDVGGISGTNKDWKSDKAERKNEGTAQESHFCWKSRLESYSCYHPTGLGSTLVFSFIWSKRMFGYGGDWLQSVLDTIPIFMYSVEAESILLWCGLHYLSILLPTNRVIYW